MRKVLVVLTLAVSCWAFSASAQDVVVGPATGVAQAVVARDAGQWTLDYVTHQFTAGPSLDRTDVVYDNTVTSTSYATSVLFGSEMGDDVWPSNPGLLSSLTFSVFNGNTTDTITNVDVTFKFYDGFGATPFGSFSIAGTLPSPLPASSFVGLTFTGLDGLGIQLPTGFILTQTYSNLVGPLPANTPMGQAIYGPPIVGASGASFYKNDPPSAAGWYSFTGGTPIGRFYGAAEVAAKKPAFVTIYDVGTFNTVLNSGTETNIGFTAGDAGPTQLQRWAAMPFKVLKSSHVKLVDVAYFVAVPNNVATVKYIVWHRTGLAAPVAVDQFLTGTLGTQTNANPQPPTDGIGDYRFSGTHSGFGRHLFGTSFLLPAGDYYLTVYGAGSGEPAAIAWFGGADSQDPALEQAFMWRSANFPSPGFAAYTSAALTPGPNMTDAKDIWNSAFALKGFLAGDMNCDGVVNNQDIDGFVEALFNAAQYAIDFPDCDYLNGDFTGDGALNNQDIDGFVAALFG